MDNTGLPVTGVTDKETTQSLILSSISTLEKAITSSTTTNDLTVPTSSVSTGGPFTTSAALPINGNDNVNMTLFISIGAVAGTILLVVIIVCICLCCRLRKKKDTKKEQFHSAVGNASTPNFSPRPEPLGANDSITPQTDLSYRNGQFSEPVYKVDGYNDQSRPYVVNENPYSTRLPSDGQHGNFSIPRPSVGPVGASETTEKKQSRYRPQQLYPMQNFGGEREQFQTEELKSPGYRHQISNNSQTEELQSPGYRNQISMNVPSEELKSPGYRKQISMNSYEEGSKEYQHHLMFKNELKESVNENRDRLYRKNSQQTPLQQQAEGVALVNKPRDAVRSGKYETKIVPYNDDRRMYGAEISTINTEMHPPVSPTSPGTKSGKIPPAVLPKSKPKVIDHETTLQKQVRKVPPEIEKKKQSEPSELTNNPVFNKRKDLIDKTCKTIRIKDGHEPERDHVSESDNPEQISPREEDPYAIIRDSRININIIPQGNPHRTREKSEKPETSKSRITSEVVYTDTVVPSTDAAQYQNDTTEPMQYQNHTAEPTQYQNHTEIDKHSAASSDHMVHDSNVNATPSAQANASKNEHSGSLYANTKHTDIEPYINIPEHINTDTGRRRFIAMRASMPPEALSIAVDELFDDALANSEIDLSKIGNALPFSHANQGSEEGNLYSNVNNNGLPPVLKKRKSKMASHEQSKADDPRERDSWRISRSSFFDEVGVTDVTDDRNIGGVDLNSAMVKKGLALTDNYRHNQTQF